MTDAQALKIKLEAKLGLLHFSLSNSKDPILTIKIQQAITATEAALSRL